jgi:hypothetical protein
MVEASGRGLAEGLCVCRGVGSCKELKHCEGSKRQRSLREVGKRLPLPRGSLPCPP